MNWWFTILGIFANIKFLRWLPFHQIAHVILGSLVLVSHAISNLQHQFRQGWNQLLVFAWSRTLPETNSQSTWKDTIQKGKSFVQPSIFKWFLLLVSERNIFHLFLSESQENRILETFSPDPLIKRFHLDLDFCQQVPSATERRDDVMNDEFHPGTVPLNGVVSWDMFVLVSSGMFFFQKKSWNWNHHQLGKAEKNWKRKGNLNFFFHPFTKAIDQR